MPKVSIVTQEGRQIGVSFECPGCKERHWVPIPPHPRAWTFNGDYNAPTLSPSVLVTYKGEDEGKPVVSCCHFFVRAGKLEFLQDCTHEYAGKTYEMPDQKD